MEVEPMTLQSALALANRERLTLRMRAGFGDETQLAIWRKNE